MRLGKDRGCRPLVGAARALRWGFLIGLGALAACSSTPPLATLDRFDRGAFSFESYEGLTWADILQQRLARKPKVRIPAELLWPAGASGRRPVMIIMHGSGGLRQEREYRYARELNKEGIAAVVLDSFSPRGVATTGGQQERVTTSTMVGDVYALLNLLQTHPQVDVDRIGLMGFSKGGSVTVFALDEQVRSALAVGGARFAVGVAFYPGCVTQLKRPKPTGAPLFMLLGEQDSYTPAVQCERQAASIRAAGGTVTVLKYAGAHHGWDSPSPLQFTRFDYSYGNCASEVDESGAVTDLRTGRRLDSPDAIRAAIEACGTRGVWVGANADAARQSLADLKTILKQTLAR
jgi:dienelactone hydrolase